MAMYNGYPVTYQQYYPQYQQPQQQASNSIIWVQGESAARSYNVAPGQSVLLMDSESSTFFVKSADASGMPMPLRIFDYTERTSQPQSKPDIAEKQDIDMSMYITRDEFEKRISELSAPKKTTSVQRKDG